MSGRGIPGERGRDGERGFSAYDVAVRRGFRGTEFDWLLSLKGPPGSNGERGDQGIQGKQGDRGARGDPGPIGPMPRHEWKGTELRFEIEPGEWGKFVDLQGPKGDGAITGFGAGPVTIEFNTYFPGGW